MSTFTLRFTPEKIREGMTPWFEKRGPWCEIKNRTPEQCAWDSAVMACAEYLRRRLDYDEKLSLELFELCVSKQAPPAKGDGAK